MGPSLINSGVFLELCHTDSHCIALVIKCPCPQKQLPMQGACSLVEASRIEQDRGSFLPHQQTKLGESQVIAYGKAHLAVFRIKYTCLAALGECLRLLIGDLPRNVDVKQVEFVELFLKKSVRIDDEGCIEELLIMPSRYRADGVHFILTALLLDSFESRRILEVLSELMHVLLHIWRIADFAQHRDIGSIFASSREGFGDVADVLKFVGHASCLQDCELELLHKI